MQRPAESNLAVKRLKPELLFHVNGPFGLDAVGSIRGATAQAQQGQNSSPLLHCDLVTLSWPPPFCPASSTNRSSSVRRIGWTASTSPPASHIFSIVLRWLSAGTVILI